MYFINYFNGTVVHIWPKIVRNSLGYGLLRDHSALLFLHCCSIMLFGNVTLIFFRSARAREIEKELQQNARGYDVVWREDAQSETLQSKFVITIVGTVPRSVLLWVCGQRVMRILP
jgi:hypothetical protein